MAVPNYNQIYSEVQNQFTAAAQPQIQSLEAQKPNLKTQYDALIGQLTNRETQDITQADRNTSQSLEERGILGGAYAPEQVARNQQPIKQYYTGQTQQAGANFQTANLDLAGKIAGLQSETQQRAIQAAMGRYNQEYGIYQQEQAELRERQFQEQQAELERQNKINVARAEATGKASSASGATPTYRTNQQSAPNYQNEFVADVTNWLGGKTTKGLTFLSFVAKYAPVMPLQNIYSLYNSTAGQKYGQPKESLSTVEKIYNANKGVGYGMSVNFY